ncbi:helix-turn-helix domain-containing protein [Leucobacter sp. UCMA 4100]|nr:helix-turn-helix domain-containing protein [Leucobacter sp. UCMA 4100]
MRTGCERTAPVTSALDELFKDRPETMDPAEVAEMLGKSKQAIYNWLNSGIIPGYKIGTSWFIIRDELKAELRDGSNKNIVTEPREGKE